MKHRGIAMSTNGMAVSAHSLISSTGLNILRKGGNAIDAAVAMANTSGVVLPDMCGLGGDVFFLYYKADEKKVYALNGSGGAGSKASVQAFHDLGMERIPGDGIYSVSVPGEADALYMALERFGTMSFAEVAEDAINLAEKGCPISEKVARHIRTDYSRLCMSEELKRMFLHEDGSPKNYGELYRNPDYAESLRIVAEQGRDAFYKGELADRIAGYFAKKNGMIVKEDLENYHSQWKEPISVDYRGYKVYQLPPVSQGIIHLEEMHLLNQFDLSSYEADSAEQIHLMIEAKKTAFNDRIRYFGDPAFNENPVKEILSAEYAVQAAGKISMTSSIEIHDSIEFNEFGHTTSFAVVDAEGNAVSFIHSIANTWGSCEVIEGTGILLNNRAGGGFNLNPDHPNCIAPGKRTMHTLVTYLVTDQDSNLKYVGNTPGGDNQPQWDMQNLVNIIDNRRDIQTALEAVKWSDIQHSNPHGNCHNVLRIEEGLDESVYRKLREMGHEVQVIPAYSGSGASSVIEIGDGVYFGAADPRGDGCAIGL